MAKQRNVNRVLLIEPSSIVHHCTPLYTSHTTIRPYDHTTIHINVKERSPKEQDWWDPTKPPSSPASTSLSCYNNKATAAFKSITPPAIANCWKQTKQDSSCMARGGGGSTNSSSSSSFNSTPTSSPTRVGDKNHKDDDDMNDTVNNTNNNSTNNTTTEPTITYTKENAQLVNIGAQNWEEAQLEWRKQTIPSEIIHKQAPPSVRTDVVIRRLSQLQRTYELPWRMKLGHVIAILDRIQNCDKDLWFFEMDEVLCWNKILDIDTDID